MRRFQKFDEFLRCRTLDLQIGAEVDHVEQFMQHRWDGIVPIVFPLPSALRVHRRVVAGLRPGGVFLREAYRPE